MLRGHLARDGAYTGSSSVSQRSRSSARGATLEDVALYTLPHGRERERVSSAALAATAQPLPPESLVVVLAWPEPVNGLGDLARRIGCAASNIAWLPGIAVARHESLLTRLGRLRRWLRSGETDLLRNSHYVAELQSGHSLLVMRGVDRERALHLRGQLAQVGALELHYHGRFTVEHLSLAQ